MKTRHWLLGLFFTVTTVFDALGATELQPSDIADTRTELVAEVQQIFQAGDYARLEKMADELRRTKARFKEGTWKLTRFYEGSIPGSRETDEAKWKEWFDKIAAWKKMFPDSITEPVVEAEGLTHYAWVARGCGFANTVTDEGWRLMSERLAQARQVLETAAKKPARCPGWYAAMQLVALGQGWDLEKYDRLFKEAVSKEPTYYEYYHKKAYYLEPKWHGKPGDAERFAEEAAKVDDPGEGMAIYARIAWSYRKPSELFRETQFQWSKMKQGFLDIEKSYPDSTWNLNNFCRFACAAGDKETARALFQRIGDKPDIHAWQSPGRYEAAKRWAFDTAEAVSSADDFSLKLPGNVRTFSVSFSPNGKQLAAGYEMDRYNGAFAVWDLESRKPLFGQRLPRRTHSVAYSPDGNWLAVGMGRAGQGEDGAALIWEAALKDEKPKYILPWRSNSVYEVRFTPDGKTLGVAGGVSKKGKLCVWDYVNNSTVDFDWAETHRHVMWKLQFTPDGQTLVTTCVHGISACDLTTRKELWPSKQTLKQQVCSLDLSTDGKLLATGCYPVDSKSKTRELGEIGLWDVPRWKMRPQKLTSPSGWIFAVAFSPDGKYLVGGGDDGSAHIWEVASGKLLKSLPLQKSTIHSLAFSADGKYLAAGFLDGTIRVQRFSLQ